MLQVNTTGSCLTIVEIGGARLGKQVILTRQCNRAHSTSHSGHCEGSISPDLTAGLLLLGLPVVVGLC